MKIGVLALQGAITEHVEACEKAFENLKIKGKVIFVKKAKQIDEIDGLIIPGGESTTIGKLAEQENIFERIREKQVELPIFGTCAGLVFLAKEIADAKLGITTQPRLGILNVKVLRNAFGRQKDSFEIDLDVKYIGKFRAVFIRAPVIEKILSDDVEILAQLNNNKIVMVRQNNILACSFHPELTDDTRIHEYFIKIINQC